MSKTEKEQKKIDRRGFLKGSVITGLGATSLGLVNPFLLKAEKLKIQKEPERHNFAFNIRKYNSIDEVYEIAPDFKRMNQKNTIFSRVAWDDVIPDLFKSYFAKTKGMVPNPLIESGENGYSKLEHALQHASFASQFDGAGFAIAGSKNQGIFSDWNRFSNPKEKEKFQFENSKDAKTYVKKAAKFLGASDVGIAKFDERWVYSNWYNVSKAGGLHNPLDRPENAIEEEAKFPFKVKSVIVTIHEMNKEAMAAPGLLGDAAAGLEYSHMAEMGHKMSLFLNSLGYKAIPAGNDTSLSVPTALQAGLGENSRMGTLIHPKFGSGVRIQKIYTDMEIEPDKPITFGVQEFCRKCKKCADNCPSNAINLDENPSKIPTVSSISSHPGVKKWFHDNEKCLSQWEKMGAGCGICLSVCPYNKPENWVHDVAKLAVGMPVGRDIARILDDSFGYGELKPENVEKFWNSHDK